MSSFLDLKICPRFSILQMVLFHNCTETAGGHSLKRCKRLQCIPIRGLRAMAPVQVPLAGGGVGIYSISISMIRMAVILVLLLCQSIRANCSSHSGIIPLLTIAAPIKFI